MQRLFTGQSSQGGPEILPTLPAWQASDMGRIVYVIDANKYYNATNSCWAEVGSSSAVEAQDSGHILLVNDAGKTFTCNSTTTQTFTLPSVGVSDVGIEFSFMKLGVGGLVIQAADSDTIEDSGEGLTIYCEDTDKASIGLKLATSTQWMIKYGATGIWTTTT